MCDKGDLTCEVVAMVEDSEIRRERCRRRKMTRLVHFNTIDRERSSRVSLLGIQKLPYCDRTEGFNVRYSLVINSGCHHGDWLISTQEESAPLWGHLTLLHHHCYRLIGLDASSKPQSLRSWVR